MKFLNLNFLIVAVIALFTVVACDAPTEGEKAKAEIKEAAEATEDWAKRESAELKVEIERAQEKIDKKIDELQADWNEATEEMRPKIDARMNELKADRAKLSDRLDQFGAQVGDNWERFKANVKETLNDVEKDLDEINAEL